MTPEGEPTKVAAIECPGWTGLDDTKHRCGPARDARYGQPNIIRATQEMCDRCHRQKAKYDQEKVLRQREAERQRQSQVDKVKLWIGDLTSPAQHLLPPTDLRFVIESIEALRGRGHFEPYHLTESTYDKPRTDDHWDVLRGLAGLPPRQRGIR